MAVDQRVRAGRVVGGDPVQHGVPVAPVLLGSGGGAERAGGQGVDRREAFAGAGMVGAQRLLEDLRECLAPALQIVSDHLERLSPVTNDQSRSTPRRLGKSVYRDGPQTAGFGRNAVYVPVCFELPFPVALVSRRLFMTCCCLATLFPLRHQPACRHLLFAPDSRLRRLPRLADRRRPHSDGRGFVAGLASRPIELLAACVAGAWLTIRPFPNQPDLAVSGFAAAAVVGLIGVAANRSGEPTP